MCGAYQYSRRRRSPVCFIAGLMVVVLFGSSLISLVLIVFVMLLSM
jgi:hypothetical protein